MALSFFRRRQKMVVVIMAFLMVSFLVGNQLTQMFTGCRSDGYKFGTALNSDITADQIQTARRQLAQLQQHVGLGDMRRNPRAELSAPLMEMHAAMTFITRSQDPVLTFLLLTREADASSVSVTDQDLNAFFKRIGLDGEYYANRVAEVREEGMPEKSFRALAAKWLRVYKTFTASVVDIPPSESTLKLVYRDLNEKIKLRMLRISADDMLKDVPKDLAEKAILTQFNSFKNAASEVLDSTDSYGFGYRQPHRVAIQYLLIDAEAAARVTRPSDKQVRDYYNERPGEFFKQVPISPPPAESKPSDGATSKASDGATSEPTPAPIEYEQVEMTVFEAMPEIRDILSRSMTEARIDAVSSVATALLGEIVGEGKPGPKDYERLLGQMLRPADSILNRTLKDVDIKAEPLDKAVAKLARAARIDGICYPWGNRVLVDVDSKVLVTVQSAVPITLRDALGRVTEQAFGKDETLTWKTCKGFNDVLFPVGGKIEMPPVSIATTSLMSRSELNDHEMFAACATAMRGGKNLVDMAFQARAFLPKNSKRSAAIEAGKDGPKMVLTGERRGRILWRLAQAVAAHVPEKMTSDIREQIVRDLQIKAAYELAETKIRKIRAIAAKEGLEAAAKEMKLETFESELFSRKWAVSNRMQFLQYEAFIGRMDIQTYLEATLRRPVAFVWNRVQDVDLPTARHREYFMEEAFSLAPADIDKPISPDAKPAIVLFPLPAKRQLLLLERTGYETAVAGEFEEQGRQQVASQLLELQRWQSMVMWFHVVNVKARTDYIGETN